MRKLAAILLGGLFLFNWVGYRALHEYLQDRATRQLQTQLDNAQYRSDQLLRLKIPTTHLSYFNQSGEFEHIEGRIDIGGIPYQYVGRRIVNDSAEYLCIPNQQALNLRNGRDSYYSLVNALGNQQKDTRDSQTSQTFFGDPFEMPNGFFSFGQTTPIPVSHKSRYSRSLPQGTRSPADHPPDRNA